MGKKCIFLNCGHYKATNKETKTPQIKQRHREGRASPGCTIYSIPPSDGDETFWAVLKLSGNVDLIKKRPRIEDIKKKFGACGCHFTNDQLYGREGLLRRTLIPGQLPTKNLANFSISDELMNEFKEQQLNNKDNDTDKDNDNVLNRIDGIQVQVTVLAGKKIKKKPPKTRTVPKLDNQENSQDIAAVTESKSPDHVRPLAPNNRYVSPKKSATSTAHQSNESNDSLKHSENENDTPGPQIPSIFPPQSSSPTSRVQQVDQGVIDDASTNSIISMETETTVDAVNETASTEKNTRHYGHHVFGDFVTMQLTFLDADIAEKVKQLFCEILDSAAQQSSLNINYTW